MSDVLREVRVERLNTLICKPTKERFEDVRFMSCRVVELDGAKADRTFDKVVLVDGHIAVMSASYPRGTIFFKTSPWIGMRARIEVRRHLPTNGLKLTVRV